MKKRLVKCPYVAEGGPSQEVCSWLSRDHCDEYNRGRNKNKCQRWEVRRKNKKLTTPRAF